MYEKNGEKYYVVDAHIALWDGRESNQKNIHGKQFIDCFYDYHKNLSPEEVVWDYDTYTYYGGERLMKDLFADGYVDHAIFQPAYLGDFYRTGFGQTEEAWALTQANPERLTYNHAFDVADVDEVATDFQGLNFVVEHCGLPRLEDFCWIATQETNVHAGLAVAMPFIHTRPRYFAQIIGELLYWIGEDKIQFSSDYAIWTPQWLVEKFVDFQIPEDMTEYPELTVTAKKKILGLNAAKMYGLDVPAELRLPEAETGEPGLEVAAGARESVLS